MSNFDFFSELILTRASGSVLVFQLIVVILVQDEALVDMAWSYHAASSVTLYCNGLKYK